MDIVMLGPQGSGKGTQAELLSKKLRLPIVAVGKIYREEIKKKTLLGQKASKYVLNGLLVPEKFTEEILKKELKKNKYKCGAIFDGFPRNLKQLKFFLKRVNIDFVILIKISQKLSIKRLSARRACPNCGENYNLLTKRPKKDLICDRCGHKLSQRADDYPAAIKKRLKIYNQRTLPLLKYFGQRGKLIKVNGEQRIEKVFKDIIKILKQKGKI